MSFLITRVTDRNSDTPFISEVTGTAIINSLSEVTVTGFNFTPDSQIVTNAGIISDIQISPEKIIFNILASAIGVYPIEVKNSDLSSNNWNNPYQAILIARNALNLTNGWLDFRTIDGSTLGSVTSHINQNLSTKTFSNSGYTLDPVRGLIFNNATFTANSTANYIQFNNFLFPLSASKFEIFVNLNTSVSSRIRFGIGAIGTNTSITVLDYLSNSFIVSQRFLNPYVLNTSCSVGNLNNNLLTNNSYIIKVVLNFITSKIEVHRLNDNSNLEATNKIEELPINFLNREQNIEGFPLINFYNSESLSSVIAIKID